MSYAAATITPSGYLSNTGGAWTNQATSGILSSDDASVITSPALVISTTYTITYDLDNTPSDFVSMLAQAFNYTIRFGQTGYVDDVVTLGFTIQTSAGVILAANTSAGATISVGQVTTTTVGLNNHYLWNINNNITMEYVNTTATKAQWDDARVVFTVINTTSMTGDGMTVNIDYFKIDYNYLQTGDASPDVFAEGTLANVTTGNLTVTLPTHATNDILLLTTSAHVPNSVSSIVAPTAPTGWTLINEGLYTPSQSDGHAAVYWKRATSSAETNPVITRPAGWDTGTDTAWAGRAFTIRGCITTGTPYENNSFTTQFGYVNMPGVTINGLNRLALACVFTSSGAGGSPGRFNRTPDGWVAWSQTVAGTGGEVSSAVGTSAYNKMFLSRGYGTSFGAESIGISGGNIWASIVSLAFVPPILSPTAKQLFVTRQARTRAAVR